MNPKRKNQKIRKKIFPRTKSVQNRQSIFIVFLVMGLLILSMGLMPSTLGRFVQNIPIFDSASAAKFDVTILPPNEFFTEQEDMVFYYHFLSGTEIKDLDFKIFNNGETDVICTFHINNGITYEIIQFDVEHPILLVKANSSVDFKLRLFPGPLNTNITDADFFIDIQQFSY